MVVLLHLPAQKFWAVASSKGETFSWNPTKDAPSMETLGIKPTMRPRIKWLATSSFIFQKICMWNRISTTEQNILQISGKFVPFIKFIKFTTSWVKMSAAINNRTKNSHLQTCLDQWMEMLREANNFSVKTNMPERQSAIDRFVRTFVPSDVTEDDISHYSNNLLGDEVR